MQVAHDWSHPGTAEQLNKYVGCSYLDQPGLYLSSTDTVLLTRLGEDGEDFEPSKPDDVLRLYVWNSPLQNTILSIAQIPNRRDTREFNVRTS